MNQKEARSEGYNNGIGAATYCEVDDSDRREAGCECAGDQVCRECLTYAAFQAEENGRQFSPFEFLAHDMNEDEDRSDGLWEAYDAGVASGIRAGVKERLNKENGR